MRRPWRITPYPAVHGWVFLRFVGIISTVSKPLRYALRREYVRARGTRGLRSLCCGEFALRVVGQGLGGFLVKSTGVEVFIIFFVILIEKN